MEGRDQKDQKMHGGFVKQSTLGDGGLFERQHMEQGWLPAGLASIAIAEARTLRRSAPTGAAIQQRLRRLLLGAHTFLGTILPGDG